MTLKIYAYKNCGTCKKALKWLNARGVTYKEIPIRETPPSVAELKKVLKAVDGEMRKLFNTSGGDYKAMDMKSKLPGMGEAEALEMLAAHGNLVKRPVVIGGGVALVGFQEEAWEAALGRGSEEE